MTSVIIKKLTGGYLLASKDSGVFVDECVLPDLQSVHKEIDARLRDGEDV